MTLTKILIAEDDRDISTVLDVIFEHGGFETIKADDGRAALRAFHEQRPDIVILDISMPKLDGWEILERIRDVSDVPVMILSAAGREVDKVRGLRGGADDYIVKPFGPQEIVARVQSLLRRTSTTAASGQDTVYDDGRLRLDSRSPLALLRNSTTVWSPAPWWCSVTSPSGSRWIGSRTSSSRW